MNNRTNLCLLLSLTLLVCLASASPAFADAIFLTGHDPDYHAAMGPNYQGARDLMRAGITFVTNPTLNSFAKEDTKFLFVQGDPVAPKDPADYIDGTLGLAASGYTNSSYDVACYTAYLGTDCINLSTALGQLGTKYSALVIGSDFGGSLTQAELNVLDQNSGKIISFLNAGGGLFAMAESDSYVEGEGHETGGLTPGAGSLVPGEGWWYGYLPFVQSVGCGGAAEDNILTPYGEGLGLNTSDVQGNWAHNCFTGSYGLNVVDYTGLGSVSPGAIQTLAGSGYVSREGVGVPEPSSLLLLATGLAALAGMLFAGVLAKHHFV